MVPTSLIIFWLWVEPLLGEHYNSDEIVHMGLLTGSKWRRRVRNTKSTHHLHRTPLCIIFYVVYNTTDTLLFYTVVSICYVHLKYKNIFPNNHIILVYRKLWTMLLSQQVGLRDNIAHIQHLGIYILHLFQGDNFNET